MFTAVQAAQKNVPTVATSPIVFTAVQAAQKLKIGKN